MHRIRGADVLGLVEDRSTGLFFPAGDGQSMFNQILYWIKLTRMQAFQSPLLADYNSNSSGRDLANASEDVETRYGSVSPGEEGEKRQLAFGQPEMVENPERGARFDV